MYEIYLVRKPQTETEPRTDQGGTKVEGETKEDIHVSCAWVELFDQDTRGVQI